MQCSVFKYYRSKLTVQRTYSNSLVKVLQACSTVQDDDSTFYYAACDLLLAAYCECLVKRTKQRKRRNSRIANDEQYARKISMQHALKHSRIYDRARRNAIKTRPACAWANKAKMAEFYALRDALNASTGIEHHVDHIVPLVGKNESGEHIVCGLHNEYNLRVTTKAENLSKGCYFSDNEL